MGLKLPNPWNLHDMHGNAWEWVQDWAGKYTPGDKVDPTGPDSGTQRIVRSGPFVGEAADVRSAYRFAGRPDIPDGGVGARILRQAPNPDTAVRPSSWARRKLDR